MGYIEAGLEFRYSNKIEMNNEDRIKLYDLVTNKYEVSADEIEKEFGINVGRQLNAAMLQAGIPAGEQPLPSSSDRHIMSDEEYYRRYGHARGDNATQIANFLQGAE